MRKILFFCVAVLTLGACSDNANLSVPVSDDTRTTFQEMYPGAKGVAWEKRGIYKVAVFSYNGERLSAWYNQDGVWCMTEQSMNINSAPSRVADSYSRISTGTGNAEIADKLTRDGIDDIYVVVEGSGKDICEFYFSAEGILIKQFDENTRIYTDYRNEIVPPVAGSVYSSTGILYPGSRIMEVDVLFPGILYITVVHDSTLKILEFSLTGAWSKTTWEVSENYVKTRCPEVYSTYLDSGHADICSILAIDYYENNYTAYYLFKLDDKGSEIDIKIDEAGKMLPVG